MKTLHSDDHPGKGDKAYFISDSHLGAPGKISSLEREKKLVAWLDQTKSDASAIYLLGDIFDFWFDYRRVVPRGHVRILGKLAEISDLGIPVHYFTGNHDMWLFDYFEQEMGMVVHHQPLVTRIGSKRFMIGHGDGLGPGELGYKMLKGLFSLRLAQTLFAFLHPWIGVGFARWISRKSRHAQNASGNGFRGADKEMLIQYCMEVLQQQTVDFFVFGHRHLPLELELAPGVKFVNTGDWLQYFSYAVFEKGDVRVKYAL